MADEIKRMTVNIDDGGTIKLTTKNIKTLNTSLDETVQSARAASKSLDGVNKAAAGGTAASRRAAESVSGAAKKQQREFDIARGTAESSGAAARDFANQSRGLGGLVRLYATFAANLFALGAAFRALSVSMDTSNMVKGLDQLGAAVGRNLGGLSKDLVQISGGAISLAQAMKAVALTSAGGLSGENIKRLGGVARTASAALGVDMPDAVSRLSRAITKLEPELLDELGIMTRLDPAVDAYARQLGKASSQLTRFEKQQAFANAVLEEGEAKFGAIEDIPVNAFDVLASSLKDIVQSMVEVINVGLVPVIKLLSSSPTALITGMLALVGIIGKQAIPAFLDFNAQLAKTADAAAEVAAKRQQIAEATRARLRAIDIGRLKDIQVRVDAEIGIQAKQVAKINALIKAQNVSGGPLLEKPGAKTVRTVIANKSTEELRKADVMIIKAQADAIRNGTAAQKALALEIDRLANSLGKEIKVGREASRVVLERTLAIGKNTVAIENDRKAAQANLASIRRSIISDVAATASTDGRAAALQIAAARTKELTSAMLASGIAMTTFEKNVFRARVGLASFGAVIDRVSGIINKLFSAFAAISILLTIFSFINQALSGNTKELEKFSSAVDDAESSVENMTRTLKFMSEKGTKGSIEGILATANAFDGLVVSMKNVIETAREAQKAATFSDKIADSFFSFFGGGIDNNLEKSLVSVTLSAIEALDQSGLKEVGEAKFREILGINGLASELNERTITEAISSLGKKGQDALVEGTEGISRALLNASSRVESFKTAAVAANLAFSQLIQSTASTDPIFRLGVTMQGLSASMVAVAASGELVTEQIDAIVLNISQNSDSAILFGPKTVANILQVKKEVLALSDARKAIGRIDKELSTAKPGSLSEKSNELKTETKDGIEIVLSGQFLTVFEQLKKQRAAAVETLKTEQAISAKASKVFNEALTESFKRGSALIAQATGEAQANAALTIRKANLQGLTGERRAREQLDITRAEIKIQIESVRTNIRLITSLEALRATVEVSNAAAARESAIANKASTADIQRKTEDLAAATLFEKAFTGKEGFSVKKLEEIVSGIPEGMVKTLVQSRGITPSSQVASQNATLTALKATAGAAEITGAAEIRKGRLEDEIKISAAQAASIELQKKALQLATDIAGTKSVEAVKQQGILDLKLLEIKQTNEIKNTQLAITNATSTKETVFQQELAGQQLLNQEKEKSNLLTQIDINNAKARSDEAALNREAIIAESTQVLQQGLSLLDVERATNDAAATRFELSASTIASMREQTDLAALLLQTKQAEAVEEGKIAVIKAEAQNLIAARTAAGDLGGAADASAELARQERAAKARLLAITTTAAAEAKITKIRTQATRELDRQNRLLKTSGKLASDLGSAFGKIGKGIGSLVDNFSKFFVNFQKGEGRITALLKERDYLRKAEIVDIFAVGRVEEDLQVARSENVTNQIDGMAGLASAGKSFFDEQSKGYKILSGIEKAFTILSIALRIERMVADTTATGVEGVNSSIRIGRKIVEAGVDGVAAVIKTLSSLPFPANLAAGALIAGIVGALLASIGGKAPKVNSSGFTAEDVQKTQGTGQDFVNGKLVDNGGGALGANDEKVQDIANSLSIISDNTLLTSSFGRNSLAVLEKIEANTRSLTAGVISSTNILSPTSAFGTKEKSSGNFFGKKSTEIIDKGVLFDALLLDLLEGNVIVQEFETLKKTKKSLFGKKKTKFTINTQDLDESVAEGFQELFSGLVDTALIASEEVLAGSSSAIENTLKDFTASFKVSGFGLSGEEFSEAILAESTVIINQLVGQALPLLSTFREIGEGFLGTLLRLAANSAVAQEQLARVGIDFASELDKVPMLGTDILDRSVLAISATNALVEGFGGLEAFVEKTNFFFENFFTEEEQLAAKTAELTLAFTDLRNEGFISTEQLLVLTDGVGNLRAEFRDLVLGQDLLTESGIEAANMLHILAPAVVAVSDEVSLLVDIMADTVGIIKKFSDSLESSLSEALGQAIAGDLEQSDVGVLAAEAIEKAFTAAVNDAFVAEITNTIISQIVTPILTGALNSTLVTGALITDVMDNIISRTEQLGAILSSPGARRVFNQLFVTFTSLLTEINGAAKASVFTFSNLNMGDLTDRVTELNDEVQRNILESIVELENERLTALQDQASAIEDAATEMKDFSNSLIDFKQSLLTSNLSPLTPAERLAEARSNFLQVSGAALSPSTSAEDRSLALGRVQESATALLEASQVFFASSSNFTADFDFVQDTLSSLISVTGALGSADDQQLAALKIQIEQSEFIIKDAEDKLKLLEKADEELEDLNKELDKITALLAAAPAMAAAQFVDGFSILDKDTSESLTFEELQRAGIASDSTLTELLGTLDTNADGELSRFEVVNGALGKTSFALQDVADILAKLNSGVITLSQAQGQVSTIQDANTAVGAGNFASDSILTDGRFNLSQGGIIGGAAVTDGTVTSKTGLESLSISDAKNILLDYMTRIQVGAISAREVYNNLINFGATSSSIASVLGDGATPQGVVDFFKSFDSSIPSFAVGTNFLPEDMLIRAHAGERIIPAADNERIIQLLNRQVNNEELILEIRELQQELIRIRISSVDNAAAIIDASIDTSEANNDTIIQANDNLLRETAWLKRTVPEIK